MIRLPPILLLAASVAITDIGWSAPSIWPNSDARVPLAGPSDGHVLPSRRCGDLFILDVMIDGKGPFAMLLDTGAGTTLVAPSVADKLGRTDPAPPMEMIDPSGGKKRVEQTARLKSLTVDGCELRASTAVVFDLAPLQALMHESVDGILGFPAFANHLLTLDYPKGEVRVAQGSLPDPDGVSVYPFTGNGTPVLPIMIDGKVSELVTLDSGANGSLQLRAASGLPFLVEPRPVSVAMQVTGVHTVTAGRLRDTLQLGPLLLKEPVVTLTDGRGFAGTGVLKHCCWTFDQPKARVRIAQGSAGPVRSPPKRGLGIGTRATTRGDEVTAVFPGGPAAKADLRAGDVVIAINGKQLANLKCGESGMDSATTVLLDIERDGIAIQVRVEVADLVP